jgi:uncharacterized damage-inducible protein DinB
MFDRTLIETFAGGGALLARSIEGLSPADLQAFPVPGTWSIHQIVIHVVDSDLTAIDRMKRIAAMNAPLLIGYDETAFSRHLHYHQQDVSDAIQILNLSRRQFARVLRLLPDEAFDRRGIHNERGEVRLGQLVGDYINHLEHHLKFIREKRKLLGR